ncbi:uncharacterized protein LOC110934032 [Helianthus annuus]|uniref:uncharacterized protein LOC110934032 n=1 Tax=Helianthus annuus TaxID=4232 RepID=UPI000B903C7D|nr:uncharacterized protein LOC110934032 [Helianthus annuus]
MAVRFVVYTGGKWEFVDGRREYVMQADSLIRGFETNFAKISYDNFFKNVCDFCGFRNITRLSYKMSDYSEPIDIIDDSDLLFFFKLWENNPTELFKLYVVQEVGVGSSSCSPTFEYKCPDLNDCVFSKDDFKANDKLEFIDNKDKCRFYEGYTFRNKQEMKIELGKMCLSESFSYKVDRSSKTRYEVSCVVENCEWSFKSASRQSCDVFYVKSFNNKHTCSKTQTHPHMRQANPMVVGSMLKEQFQNSGRIYRCPEIVKDLRIKEGVNITYMQAWRGKNNALQLLHGNSASSFAELPIYCYNLEKANPGTVTHILTDSEDRFEMVFVALGAAIRAFVRTLRPVIIIDAAHLKGEFKGTLFLAVGMDGNNQILPVGYGIGKSEDGNSWTWFLSKLKDCIGDHPELAIISDRAPSIQLAENESLWWQTCKSYRLSDFEESFNALCAAVPRLRNTLTTIGFEKWSRAHCPVKRYHYMTSNSAESMNALSKHSRKLPVTQLIEFFRQSVQKWFYDRRNQGIHGEHLLTEWAVNKIQHKIENSRTWTVTGVRVNSFEVEDGKKRGFVDLANGTCTCRVWQLSGLPCGHVIAVSRFLGESDCGHYSMSCYSNEVYKATYAEEINPIPHKSEWEKPDGLLNLQPPNITKRQSGRPKENKRILSRGEEPTPIFCGRCRSHGHHRESCRHPTYSQSTSRGISTTHVRSVEVEPEDFRDYVSQHTIPTYNLGED